MFQGSYANLHQGSAIDLFKYLMMLGAGRDYRLRKIS